jgi:hypothetical protein
LVILNVEALLLIFFFCAAAKLVEIAGLVKALQSVNRSTWHDAFLALWVASLRLVQRVSFQFSLCLFRFHASL